MSDDPTLTPSLLGWYADRRRLYPWRGRPTPYRVLVSEVMLQQTQAARVVPAFRSFLRRFPSVRALAAAPVRDVLAAWSGLGYNRRAVRLSAAARLIERDHGGRVPASIEALTGLPGVGPYTAAAVASIAYRRPVPAVDTNVRRVVARAVLGRDGPEVRWPEVRDAAVRWMNGTDPSDWNQAVMDLGREICRSRPRCERCPLASPCAFRAAGRTPVVRVVQGSEGFEGSFRQLRGTIVRVLAGRSSATLATLAEATARPVARVAEAIAALEADGLVAAGPGARLGRPAGRVRLRS
jgi:A/G-specific adenine glycosylase